MRISIKFSHYLTMLCILLLPTTLLAAGPLQTFDGKPASLEQYTSQGKWLVVMLWASDCLICNQEIGEYTEFHKAHNQKDAIVVGISMDGNKKKKEAEDFIKRHKVNFSSLIGDPFEVASLYQKLTGAEFRGTPSFMVYGPDGKIRGAQAGAVPVSIIESFIERELAETSKKPGS